MSAQNLEGYWAEHKEAIGQVLPLGAKALADVLKTGCSTFGLTQRVREETVQWLQPDGEIALMFCVIRDPRSLDQVLGVLERVRDERPRLTAILVHQWMEGAGTWDVFLIPPDRRLRRVDRICGAAVTSGRGPVLREDIYALFASDAGIPAPASAAWARLLMGPGRAVRVELGRLAKEHSCTQTLRETAVTWTDSNGEVQAQFFILPAGPDLETLIRSYQEIRATRCTVSFVLTKAEREGAFDIFRFSARSYLEHHRQVKIWAGEKAAVTGLSGTPTRELQGLRWVPRWASHVGCLKGCLNYLGVTVSDAWLFGASGHAFVLNISPRLCPSGPTDWDTSTFLRLVQNIGGVVERVDQFCLHGNPDLGPAQEEAWQFVQHAIAQGHPCYGWELDIPEYAVIFGHDATGYYISGPGCDTGKGPLPWRDLGRSEIGVVLVASVRAVDPAEDRRTVREALVSALDMAFNRRQWTDRAGGLKGYDQWMEALERGCTGRFGLGYNAAVWAESRRFAADFLGEAGHRLGGELRTSFDEAIGHYDRVARQLKTVSELYPFQERSDECVAVDQRSREALLALGKAREAEVAGLAVLADLVGNLAG